jgi:hypothetical protein
MLRVPKVQDRAVTAEGWPHNTRDKGFTSQMIGHEGERQHIDTSTQQHIFQFAIY